MPRRRRVEKARRGMMTPLAMIGWLPTGDDDADRELWFANRHHWPAGNQGTAPDGFWMFEPCVPEGLRDGIGVVVNTEENRARFDLLEQARREWLGDRDWRELTEV
jgi:hypothetical protein